MKILIQVAEGIEEMQKLHIVHRDLKPENILLTKELNAKICDLGISV